MVRYRVKVSGSVQGVWYRQSCRREASVQGVAGWVRNNADGSVEAVLEGEPEAVERVLAWMTIGPPHATVTTVDVQEEMPRGEAAFTVR
jgi:acylphosphatase